MRVLHINTARTWRGGERQVLNLSLGLREQQVEQLIVGQPGSALEQHARAEGLPFAPVAMRGELDFLAPRRIAQLATELGADIVHAHTSKAHTQGLRAVARLHQQGSRAGLIVSRRVDFGVGLNWFSRRKYLSPLVERYIAVSQRVREVMIASGVSGDRVGVVHSAIDPIRYKDTTFTEPAQLRREFDIGPRELILGNVAALVDHKDQRTLIAAMADLQKDSSLPAHRLLILGAGELEGALREQAHRAGLLESGRVIFTGFRDDVLSFYRMMDVFVMSSKEEGLGTALLDALYFGLPVATTAGGGIPEIVDHDRGGLVTPIQDPSALAGSLERLLNDAKLRQRFGEYNRKRLRDFSVEALVAGTLREYRAVAAARVAGS